MTSQTTSRVHHGTSSSCHRFLRCMGSYHFCPQGTIPIHPRRPWYDYYLIAEAASLSEAHIFHSNGRESLPMTCYCTLIQFVVLWLVDNCLLADGAFSLLSLLLSVLSLSTTQLLETYDITSLQYIYGCIIRPPPAPLSTRRQWTVYNRMGHNGLLHEINTCVESVLVLPLKPNSFGLTNNAYIQWELHI